MASLAAVAEMATGAFVQFVEVEALVEFETWADAVVGVVVSAQLAVEVERWV